MHDTYLYPLAEKYHEALPQRIREYLHERGLDDAVIDRHLLGWNGGRIVIPIFNRQGDVAFFKLAKAPNDFWPGPKIMATPGAYAELYGWEVILKQPEEVIICEGEFDRLVLETNGFQAVTSTGGAGTFRAEWAKEFTVIRNVYICFDRDNAGQRGARKLAGMIPHAKLVELPEDVGKGGDVTDFFVRLGWKREVFLKLLETAISAPPQAPARIPYSPNSHPLQSSMRERIERIRGRVPIEKVIGEYVLLKAAGKQLVGLCPFHEDHNPSLTVYPETNTFHCYGCGKRGDVISFVQDIEHMSFSQALAVLDHFMK
jgi:DNA primase